jgi:O-antigen/teichoic acid export membrane protein/O-antigen ligase
LINRGIRCPASNCEAVPLLTSIKRPAAHERPSPASRLRARVRSSLPGISPAAVGGTLGTRLAAAVLGFGVGIVAARALGPHGRAQLALMMAVPAIFSVVGVLGLDNANARFAGLSHSAFRQLVGWAVLFSAVVGTALAAAWWFAGSLWPTLLLGLGPRLALMSAVLCPVSLLATLLGAAEIGRGRIGVYNMVMAVTTAAYLIGVVLVLVEGHATAVGCFIVFGASQILAATMLLVLAATRVHPDGDRVSLRRYGGYALRAYLPNLAHYGMLRMDIPVIQILAGTAAVALYAVALPIAEGLLLLPAVVALVIFPRVTSGAVDQAAADRIGRTVTAVTVVLAAAVASAAPVFIPVLYGAPYRGAVVVVWWMLPGLVIFSLGRTLQAYLAATDRLRPAIVATAAGGAVGLACLAALTPRFGAAGAAIADSAGYLGFTVILVGGSARSRIRTRLITGSLGRGRLRVLRVAVLTKARGSVWPVTVGCVAAATGLAAALISTHGMAKATMVASAVTVLIVIATPDAGLYLLAVAIPVSQTTIGASLITDKALAVLIVACVIGHFAARRIIRPKTGVMLLAIALVCYFLLSATLAGGGSGNGQSWRDVLILSAPLLCLSFIMGADALTRHILILFSFTAACLAVPEVITARASLTASVDVSAIGSAAIAAGQTGAVNHNSEGALFVLALGVLLARFPRTGRGAMKLATAAAIVALAVGVAFSFSRSAYFGALAVIALFAARRSIRGLVGAAVCLGGLWPLLPAAVVARLATVWSSSGLDTSSTLRLDLWSSALRMFDAHPVLGVGFLNFANQLPEYFYDSGNYSISLVDFSSLDYAHNTYLTIAAETGVVGAVLVGALVVAGWRRVWSAARSGDWASESAMLGFVGVGICAAFGEVLFVPPILAAFLLVVLAGGPLKEVAHDRVAGDAGAVGHA